MKIKFYALAISALAAYFSFCFYNDAGTKIKTEFYFGLSNSDGPISDEAWEKFKEQKAEHILNGFTEIDAKGFWKSPEGKTYHEKSIILVYIHDKSATEDKKITSLIELYKKEFKQESVLVTNEVIDASFK